MTSTGNCIYAAHGGPVSTAPNGNQAATDNSCRVITTIYNINLCCSTKQTTLKGPAGEVVGMAMLAEAKDGVIVATELHGLAPGKYSMKLQSAGKCDLPRIVSTRTDRTRQLPDLEITANGTGSAGTTVKGATLDDGPNGLLGPDGMVIVIEKMTHAEFANDSTSRPAACGVVTPATNMGKSASPAR